MKIITSLLVVLSSLWLFANNSAYACSQGQYQDAEGNCKGCQDGWISAGGSSKSCTQCPAGTAEHNHSTCTPCSAGQYQPYAGGDGNSCVKCQYGYTSKAGAKLCDILN